MSDEQPATREDAIAALSGVLRAPDAKPADRLRAAEALLRAHGEGLAPTGSVHELDDQALMLIARGVHPPERGPAESRAGAVPSHAHTERSALPALSDEPPALGDEVVALPGLRTPKGTQNGPAKSDPPPAPNPFLIRHPKGTQKGPVVSSTPPPATSPFALAPEIGDDPDPWE